MAGGDDEHVQKIKKSKFNRQRDSTVLRQNCGNDGYLFNFKAPTGENSGGQCQVHHVLPVCTLQDGNINIKGAEKMDFIHKCMAMTQWNINEQPNLIGLPTKQPYAQADREAATRGATAASLKALSAWLGNRGALPDLPCHLYGHDKYNDDVIDQLNEYLWPELLKNRKKCEDSGQDIKDLLEDHSEDRKDWIKTRGSEHGGAADCWVNREMKRSVWYIPLSLAPDPDPVDPPLNVKERDKSVKVKEWLSNMFSAVSA